jgi:hypothetical protein
MKKERLFSNSYPLLIRKQSYNVVKKTILLFLIVFAGYSVLAIFLFYPLVFLSKILVAPDSLIPLASTIALDRVQEATGTYPLWQPWIFSGMPTVEAFSYLSGLYFPNAFFSLFHADGIFLQLLHLVFAGFGLFLLLREYRLNALYAFFGGAVFMLNPYMTAMLVHGHGSQLMTAAYMPWMLWSALRLIQRQGLADAGILALIAGLQLQRAHVQIAYYSWMLMLPFILFLIISRRYSLNQNIRLLLLLLVALACGIAMTAAIYFPALQYAAYSVRGAADGGGASWEYATLWSMHPLELLTFLVPGIFGFGGVTYWGFMPFTDFPHYAGIVVLFLAISGAVISRKSPLTWFLSGGLLLFLLLSFGSFFSPVFNLFYYTAPLFSKFRVPSMALIMVYMILSFFAAIGLNELLQCKADKMKKTLQITAILIAVFVFLFTMFEHGIEAFFRALFPTTSVESLDMAFMVNKVRWDNLKESFLFVILAVAFSVGLLFLYMRNLLSRKVLISVLILISLADIIWIDMQIIYPSADSLRSPVLADTKTVDGAFRHDDITRYLASRKGLFRIYPAGSLFMENKFALFGIESVGGYHPAKLKLYEEFLAKTENLASLNILRMLNVVYIISSEPMVHPALELVKTGSFHVVNGAQNAYVYTLQGSAPRAWFAGRVTALKSDEALFAKLIDEHATLDEAYIDSSQWTGTRTFAAGKVSSIEKTPESMLLKVSAQDEAFLVVSEIFYPLRWKVTIDGKRALSIKVNGMLRGVIIPKGSREVSFIYDRNGFENGRILSFSAFSLALLMIVGGKVTMLFQRNRPIPKKV